tara:strand:+ start:63 stop:644 length:582 start_codon:yes stop_codon:yes gene_type:complete
MKKFKKTIKLKNKNFTTEYLSFNNNDKKMLRKFFEDWEYLCQRSYAIGASRKINLPESLSEALFCLTMKVARRVGGNASFDCYDFKNKRRIQVKASSSVGPTQFGPKTDQDDTYFLYFKKLADYKDIKNLSNYPGEFLIYKLNNSHIDNVAVNKTQTLKDQKEGKRRGRFNVYNKLIKPYNIKPIVTEDIKKW